MVLDFVVPTPKGTTWGKTTDARLEYVLFEC